MNIDSFPPDVGKYFLISGSFFVGPCFTILGDRFCRICRVFLRFLLSWRSHADGSRLRQLTKTRLNLFPPDPDKLRAAADFHHSGKRVPAYLPGFPAVLAQLAVARRRESSSSADEDEAQSLPSRSRQAQSHDKDSVAGIQATEKPRRLRVLSVLGNGFRRICRFSPRFRRELAVARRRKLFYSVE